MERHRMMKVITERFKATKHNKMDSKEDRRTQKREKY